MLRAKFAVVALALSVGSASPAIAQRHNNPSACDELVSGLCQNGWELNGFDNYQDCYAANIGNCETQQSGDGVYDQVIIKGPRCVSPSGIQLC
jgi:hypothetical protein